MEAFKASGGEVAKRKSKKNTDSDGGRKEKCAKKDPGAPKKPPNAYWLWLAENRASLVKELGTGAAGAVGKLAGEKFKALAPGARKIFEDKAASLKAEYEKAKEEYKKNGGGGQAADEDGDEDDA